MLVLKGDNMIQIIFVEKFLRFDFRESRWLDFRGFHEKSAQKRLPFRKEAGLQNWCLDILIWSY